MELSILYCGECESILAASPGLGLTVECIAHTVGGVSHKGYVALRLTNADVMPADLADLTLLAAKYSKAAFAAQLKPLAGSCP